MWVDGPDGAWEIYTVLEDSDTFGQTRRPTTTVVDSLLLRVRCRGRGQGVCCA